MHWYFLESRLFTIFLAGLFLLIIGYVWLLIRAFRTYRGWGWFSLFVPGVGPLFFSIFRWNNAKGPLALLLLGGIAVGSAYGINKYQIWFPDLGERNKIVDKELHLTLTGWDRKDYSILERFPQAVVVQMANSDVTDETLKYLRKMKSIKELDLNDTKITDAGLAELAELPIERLRLRGTGITESGFVKYLQDKKTLKEIDLRKTAVTGPTLRSWKAAAEGRSFLR